MTALSASVFGSPACRTFVSSRGAPKIATISSPTYLSSVPRWLKIASVISSMYSLSLATTSSGRRPSQNFVNPHMSEKRTVSFFLAPPSLRAAGFRRTSSIISLVT